MRWARHFDTVFVEQRACLEPFRRAGHRAHWLPVGCDEQVAAAAADQPRRHDVVFVGTLSPSHERRGRLLARLRARFDVSIERAFLEDMTRALRSGRISFNCSMSGGLNQRVYETLAAGTFLLTDHAPGTGLDEMFRDGLHLALYRNDDELEPLVERYLRDEAAREAIAVAGRSEALRRHTYRHLALQLLRVLSRVAAEAAGSAGSERRREPRDSRAGG
jgi:hypothetical protein